jgi:type IV pilus assembly protein PilC
MAEYVLKYADARGEVRHQVTEAGSEQELRDRLTQQGFLVYSIKPKNQMAAIAMGGRRAKLDMERFLIFNQQFVTLIRAGLPILKALDLLADRLTDPKLGQYIKAVRADVRNGSLLSDAFKNQAIFPPMYTTSVMAGEKSGSLVEVLDRFLAYQRLSLAVRKKIIVSLIYPALLTTLVIGMIIFLITYVVPNFAVLYKNMSAELPAMTKVLIAVGTTARSYILVGFGILVAMGIGFRIWARAEDAQAKLDRIKLRTPILGDIWVKFQVAQFGRVLSTLLVGGIPLVQGLETAIDSIGAPLLRRAVDKARKGVREGQSLSRSLEATGIFPALSIDMIEVGESTGALPQMLNSVAEFYEEDVNTRMTAVLSLIEPAIMIFMGIFVAFVLISLYLPIFSLAESL